MQGGVQGVGWRSGVWPVERSHLVKALGESGTGWRRRDTCSSALMLLKTRSSSSHFFTSSLKKRLGSMGEAPLFICTSEMQP